MYLFFSFFLDTLFFLHQSCDHLMIANIVLLSHIYDDIVIISPISLCVVYFLFLYTCFLLCM